MQRATHVGRRTIQSKITVGATVSLDGYIAGPDETGFEHLFAWFDGGDVEFPGANPDIFRLTEPDHRYLRDLVDGVGAFVVGRRLFDFTDGWGGTHPFIKPVVVVTHGVPEDWIAAHPDAPFTFVTDGLVPPSSRPALSLAIGTSW